jgi:geranylgeranyl diphosphate synthase, type I
VTEDSSSWPFSLRIFEWKNVPVKTYKTGYEFSDRLPTCPKCGRETSFYQRFCPSCGIRLRDVSSDLGFPVASSLQPTTLEIPRNFNGSALKPSFEFSQGPLSELVDYIRPVNSRLLESHRDQPPVIYAINMNDHLVGAVLPQICCEAVGGKAYDAIDLAYAYSLGLIAGRICDDMMDRTNERRGKRTIWRQFGDPVAIPLGLQLVSEMFDALSTYDLTLGRTSSERINRVFRLALAESARAEGEEKLANRSKATLTFGEGIRFAQGKRGILVSAGTTSAAIVGGGTELEIELLKNYGMAMGTANQLFDDSRDPDYPKLYREKALSESRNLTAEGIKSTDQLKHTEAQRKLRELCKMAEIPLL